VTTQSKAQAQAHTMTPPVTTQSKAQAQAHTMTPPVLTFDLSLDLSPLPLPPPYADVEGGAEQWQRELDAEWAQYVQTGRLCPPEFELTLADYEEMAEPDFSDDEFLVDDIERRDVEPSEQIDFGSLLDLGSLLDIERRESEPTEQIEIGRFLDVDADVHVNNEPNMRLNAYNFPPSPTPRTSLGSTSAV